MVQPLANWHRLLTSLRPVCLVTTICLNRSPYILGYCSCTLSLHQHSVAKPDLTHIHVDSTGSTSFPAEPQGTISAPSYFTSRNPNLASAAALKSGSEEPIHHLPCKQSHLLFARLFLPKRLQARLLLPTSRHRPTSSSANTPSGRSHFFFVIASDITPPLQRKLISNQL